LQECNPPNPTIQAPTPPQQAGHQYVHSLYLHVPFCFHKCHYCDFYSLVEPKDKTDRQQPFTNALIAELNHLTTQHDLQPKTIFVGGGTPTLLRTKLWDSLLTSMRQLGLLDNLTEFTVEANPETVTPDLIHTLASAGVNRVSLGAQSFNTDQLKTLERWHDPDSVPKAVDMLQDAGITNFNLDLIFAIPHQTLQQLDQDLDAALALNPTHLSCYSLIFEPNTPLTQKMKMGRISPVGEELEKQMYAHIIQRLDAEGFEHYEVSNWAKRDSGIGCRGSGIGDQGSEIGNPESMSASPKPRTPRAAEGASAPVSPQTLDPRPKTLPLHPPSAIPHPPSNTCQHNMAYWTNKNWLGLGPAAASHIHGKRWKNLPNLSKYIQHAPTPPTTDHEQLPPKQHIGELIMLGLRLRQGLTLNWINQHIPISDPRQNTINEMIDLNLLERTQTHLRLTRNGLFLADSVIAKLL
jgi:coproporphyrinogen III oxidase-like Fe-S oxidoreductase